MYRFSIRLRGIDCPEIRGKTDQERQLAQDAKLALSNLILGKRITLQQLGNEKYGRVLANVYLGEVCVNDYLLEHGYAVKYDGGTKSATWGDAV